MKTEKISNIERIILIIFIIILFSGGIIFGYVVSEIKNYSGINNLKKFQPSIPTRLYDVNGEVIAELFREKRDMVSYEDLPQSLVNAFIAAEDKNFYNHYGIDPGAITRAMIKNIIASIMNARITVVQGGSTITQQLAKRLFTSGERTIGRKILEAVLALQIEKKFSKEEILEMYFNQIYLGHGCHGIATAARFFFNKDVKYLTVVESSVLAALPSKPGGFSPLMNPKKAFIKNRDTLDRMVDEGFLLKERSDDIYSDFWPSFIELNMTEYPTKTAISKNIDEAPYFTDYVRQILHSRYGRDMIYNEGLNIYTTLNLKRQKLAQGFLKQGIRKQNEVSAKANAYYNSAVDRGLIGSYNTLRMIFSLPSVLIKNDIETRLKKKIVDDMADSIDIISLLVDHSQSNQAIGTFRTLITGLASTLNVEGALIAVEPKTGYITSMIGGSEFQVSNQYNRAIQARRQPGSAFKPFVYGSGIESKIINAGTAIPDAPIIDIDAEGDTWVPGNYEGEFSGLVRVRRALASSINIISVRIFDLIGPERIIEYAAKILKVPETRFNPNPTLALGTTELTPYEMVNAYAIYANRGRDVIPIAIRYIIDRDGNEVANIEEELGNIIAAKEMDGTIQVISEDVAFIMTSLMRDVIDRGTANRTIRADCRFTQKAAGKTGTTSNWTDAWFCGFTPDISTAVWIGYDRPFMSLGKHQAGSVVAGPIWANYMREIYNGMPDPEFSPMPENVYRSGVCAYTGLIPSDKCDKIAGEFMIKGSGPNKTCDGNHKKMKSVLDRYMEEEGLKDKE